LTSTDTRLGRPPNPATLHRIRATLRSALNAAIRDGLHDLRHGAATLAHAAGADLKTVQEQLGHTSIVLTADTYTSVLLDLHFTVAEATARLVLAAAARNPGRRHRTGRPESAATEPTTRPEPLRPKRSGRAKRHKKGRAAVTHTRHTKIKAA
jgi:hypothetical protein